MKKLFLVPVPAILIGSLAMYINDVSIMIWSQNIFGFIIAVLLSYQISRKPKIIKSVIIIPVCIVLLLLTFLDLGVEGVQRWVAIGPIRFYISSIVLPMLIIGLWRILRTKNWWITASISIGISLILALQPDASQTTAFIIPMAIILFSHGSKNHIRYSFLGVLSLIVIYTWVYLDALPPVDYVEDIVKMVAEMGSVWFVLGITSLLILPLPFILFPPRNSKLLSICLGIYFAIVLISTLFGNFPVPLMGYGISPILGYLIAMAWLIDARLNTGLPTLFD